uniref:RNA1 polyprotein n=1 Tax=Asian lizard's tail nepovirus TaxID=3115763 RepID=A0AAT9JAT7_9SECO
MSLFCSAPTCLYRDRGFTRAEARELGYRCCSNVCNSLLVKRVDSAPATPKLVDSATTSRTARDSARATEQRRSVASAPLIKQRCAIVVRVDPPGLDLVYPPLVKEDSAAAPVKAEPVVEVIPTIPTRLAPKWLVGGFTAKVVVSAKPLPEWLVLLRRLLKAALKGSSSFGPSYIRRAFSKARVMWVLSLITKRAPPTAQFGAQLKKSALALFARIERARLAKQAKRQERRQEACRKVRLLLQARRATEALTRQEASQTRHASLYAVTVGRPTPLVVSEATRVCKKPKRTASPPCVPLDTFDWASLGPGGEFYVPPSIPTRGRTLERSCSPRRSTPPPIRVVSEILRLKEANPEADWEGVEMLPNEVLATARPLLSRCAAVAQKTGLPLYLTELIKEIRGSTFLEHAKDISEALAREESALEPVSSNLQGFFSSVKSFASSAAELAKRAATTATSAVKSSWEFVFDKIVATATGIFDSIFLKYLEHTPLIKNFVLDFWAKVKKWTTTLSQTLGAVFEIMHEAALWSVCIIVGASIVCMVEKVLISMGIMTAAGSCVGLFLTLFFSYLGVRAFLAGADKLTEICEVLKRAVHVIVEGRTTRSPLDAPTEVGNAQAIGPLDTVLGVVSSIGSGLVNFKMGTVLYWAKIGSALEQLRKGKDVLKDVVSWLVETLGRIYDSITGKETQFFDQLSALVQVDVRHWLAQSQNVLLEAQTMALTDKVLLLSVARLVEDGNKLLLGVSGIPRKLTLDFFTLINKVLSDLKKVHESCVKAGRFEGRRHTPFWLYLFGPSHCGKSLLMEQAADVMLTELGLPISSNALYTKTATDKFWSGYRREYCIMLDDLSAVRPEGVALEAEMLNIVSSQEYKPNMPFEGEKGMYFDSPIIISSSNVFDAPTSANILDERAYRNRRGAVLECRRAMDENGFSVEFDPTNPHASTECRFVDKHSGEAQGPWMNCLGALEMVRSLLSAHVAKETVLQANYMGRRRGNHPTFDAAHSFLECVARDVSVYAPRSLLQSHNVTPDNYLFYAQVDGVMYGYGVNGDATALVGTVPGFEEICMERVLPTLQQTLAQRCHNGMVSTFLQSLVSTSCSVVSVKGLSDSASAVQKDFFHSLSTGEQVYLRLVQKKMNKFMLDEVTAEPVVTKVYNGMINGMRSLGQIVWENSGKLLMICAAILAMLVVAQGLFGALSLFAGTASIASGVGVLHSMDVQGLSNASSSSYYDSTRGRNIRVTHKHMNTQGGNAQLPCSGASLSLYGPNGFFAPVTWARNRSFWITRHQAKCIADRSSMALIMSDGTRVTFLWEESRLKNFSDSEICRYSAPAIPPLPKKLADKWYLNDYEAQINMTTCEIQGVTVRKTGSAYEDREICWWRVPGSVVYKMLQISDAYLGGSYVHYIPKYIHYSARTQLNDCGAYICALIKGDWRIIGFHVSEKNGQCAATLVPDIIEQDAQAFNFMAKDGVLTDGYKKIGFLPPNEAPHMPTKTQYVQVPNHVQLPMALENCKVPAILTADDERIPAGTNFDPFVDGMTKFAEPMVALDQDILDRVAEDIVMEWGNCEAFDDVSLHVAINGVDHEEMDEKDAEFLDPMVLNTSEGYPFLLERKSGESGKARYFQGEQGDRKLKEGTSVYKAYSDLRALLPTTVPELVCVECPKDERTAKKKVFEKPKTRLFSILPLHFNLCLREKFLAFTKFFMQERHRLPSQVGVCVYSREWLQLYARLGEKNNVAINCDYTRFDGIMTPQILSKIGEMINRTYRNDSISRAERFNLLMSLTNRKSIANGDVFEVRCGIPSGCALTVLLNCIFNEILIRYCFAILVPAPYKSCFSQYVCLLVYGDDNLIAVAPSLLATFNGNNIKRELAKVGVSITDGIDKYSPTIDERPLEDLNFLKRGFKVTEGDRVRAPLEMSSLLSSVIWVSSKGEDVFDKLFLNVQIFLRELYHHDDPILFGKIRAFYSESVPSWSSRLYTWRQVCDFHHEQLTGMRPMTAAQDLDILIRPEVRSFCVSEGKSDFSFSIGPGVKIAGCKYRAKPTDLIVSFSDLFAGESESANVVREPVTIGSGVGGLPTRAWGLRFRSPKKWIHYARALACIRDGGNVIFRDLQPCAAAWIAAIYFADATHIVDIETSKLLCGNLCGNKGHQICKYFDNNLVGDHVWKFRGPSSFGKKKMATMGWDIEHIGELTYSFCSAKHAVNLAIAENVNTPLVILALEDNRAGQRVARVGARCSPICKGHTAVKHNDGVQILPDDVLVQSALRSLRTHLC